MKKFNYVAESTKHVYGKSNRWPGEKLFVQHINTMHELHPDYKFKLIGTSGVHGEYFPLFQTKCIFELPDQNAIDFCVRALKESDELIRRRIDSHWEWNSALEHISEPKMMFFVNWHDFAYFIKHKEIFLAKDHSKYAMDFGLDVQKIQFEHYKIFKDGRLEVFDKTKISSFEKEVVAHIDEIHFTRKYKDKRF